MSGKSADGSDARQIEGMYESPCGIYWSNKPYTREQKAYSRVWHHCERYNKTWRDLYNQVKAGSKENLPKWVRDWLIKQIENEV
jgi:hypothetical protein